jgi:tellurite resistance protein TerC
MTGTDAVAAGLQSVGSPALWAVTIVGVLVLLVLDFAVTHRPHRVSIREALGWSVFYIALPLAFGGFIWLRFGSGEGLHYLTGYLVEKSLSVDNLFVFMLLLAAFAVPPELAQRVLLFGITGALVLRAAFIALGAAALQTLDWAFLLFAAILIFTAIKLLRETIAGDEPEVDISAMRSVRLIRRFMPVTDTYQGTKMITRVDGRLGVTPLALVVVAVLTTDVIFAVDSVPAVYGITEDPYLVFVTNAFALLGLRALYFVVHAALARLVHLSYGLAVILALIGAKLALHWAHGVWPAVPTIPTPVSLLLIVVILTVVTITSLRATRPATRPAGAGRQEKG